MPERQAKWPYISNVWQKTITYNAGGKPLKAIAVGKVEGGAKAVVIYIHGQGGTRAQGADNGMFGGNFNRIMNLMAMNDGAYLSPDFTDIGDTGAAEIKALVLDQAARSPDAAIFVACGSQGGAICWRLVADADVSPHLAGLLLLGSTHDDAFLKSPFIKPKARRLPIYLGHGTADPIFAAADEVAFYAKVRKVAPGYPIRIALFDTGVHGTPIRMTDWRMVLNWMLEAAAASGSASAPAAPCSPSRRRPDPPPHAPDRIAPARARPMCRSRSPRSGRRPPGRRACGAPRPRSARGES